MANGTSVEDSLTHLILTGLTFTNNTSLAVTCISIYFAISHQNVNLTNCTFGNNYSPYGSVISINTAAVTKKEAYGETIPVLLSGTLVLVKYPPKYVSILNINAYSNFAQKFGIISNIGNMDWVRNSLNGNGVGASTMQSIQNVFLLNSNSYIQTTNSYSQSFDCLMVISFKNISIMQVIDSSIQSSNCPNGFTGFYFYGSFLSVFPI